MKSDHRFIEMGTKIKHPYITRKKGVQGGKLIISGTRTPVSSIVFHHKMGDIPEEILNNLPHLTLSQIYDALSYYYDHKEEVDREMEADTEKNLSGKSYADPDKPQR